MRIHAHAAVVTAIVGSAAPLFMFQSPAPSVYADTKISSINEIHQISKTHTSKAKTKRPKKHTAKAKKVTVTVKPGDSLSVIASAHHTTWVRIFNANKQISDPNIIHVGQKLTIPPKGEKLPNRYKKLTSAQLSTMPTVSSGAVRAASTPLGGANTYTRGYCTWYVKNQRPDISNHWGNASPYWLSEARADGYSTGATPHAGAIAVSMRMSHVAIVTGSSDHGRKVSIAEMNYAGGVGVVHTRTVPSSWFQYIY